MIVGWNVGVSVNVSSKFDVSLSGIIISVGKSVRNAVRSVSCESLSAGPGGQSATVQLCGVKSQSDRGWAPSQVPT